MDYLDLGIHISNLKSVLARSACRMQMQWEIRPVFSAVLCNVANCRWTQTVKRGKPHQGSRDQESAESAVFTRGEWANRRGNNNADPGFIEPSLANIQFEFVQAQKDCPEGDIKATEIRIRCFSVICNVDIPSSQNQHLCSSLQISV